MPSVPNKLRGVAAAATLAATAAAAPTADVSAADLPGDPIVERHGVSSANGQPVVNFDHHQQILANSTAQTEAVCWHRQKGKDFTAAGIAVKDAFVTGHDWFIISITQRQADATFRKAKAFARALQRVMNAVQVIQYTDSNSDQRDPETGQRFVFKAREIILPGGGRIMSLPGRDPDALAGLTGNLILTEFALFPNGGHEHWEVVFPLTTRGYRTLVISTPRGKETKFYELCTGGEANYHRCTIWDSVAAGWSPVPGQPQWTTDDVDDLKRRYGNDAKFAREYECEFSGDLDVLIKWTLLEQAAALAEGRPFTSRVFTGELSGDDLRWFEQLATIGRQLGRRNELGWDVARRGDLAATALNVATGTASAAGPRHLAGMALFRDVRIDQQRDANASMMRADAGTVGAGDSTGLGLQGNEELEHWFKHRRPPGDGLPASRWTPVTFGAKSKGMLASGGLTRFGDGAQTLPPVAGETAWVAADLYGLHAEEKNDRLVLDETGNPHLPDSHNDPAYAILLAQHAGGLHPFHRPLPKPTRKPAGL
jgi:phage FluMu gp28-like protein